MNVRLGFPRGAVGLLVPLALGILPVASLVVSPSRDTS